MRQADSLLVLPKRYPLPAITLPGARHYQPGGVTLSSSVGNAQEFLCLRDYQPGDPLRAIHWRSWAKSGKPIVQEFQDEYFVRHGLVLDTFDPADETLFEEAVSVAASFACTTLTQESLLDLLFVGDESYCFTSGRGLGQAEQLLTVLAGVSPAGQGTFQHLEQLVLSRASQLSSLVLILLAWDQPRRRLVQALRGMNIPLLVLAMGRDQESGPDGDGVHWLHPEKVEEGLSRQLLPEPRSAV